MKNLTPKQQEWLKTNNKTYPIICKCCTTPVKWYASSGKFGVYCSSTCSKLDKTTQREKQKQTNLSRYGVETSTKNKEVTDKRKRTCLERYGHENIAQGVKKHKVKQTMIERYGCVNAQQNSTVSNKTKQTNIERYGGHPKQTTEVQDKYKATCLEKYGVEHHWASQEIKDKIKQTFNNIYGCHPKQSDGVQDKYKATCLEKYGVEHHWASQEIKDKIKQTNIKKYGTNNPTQHHMVNILHLLNDYDWLCDQYISQDKTATQIADELQITTKTVCAYLKKLEIEIKQIYWTSYKARTWLDQLNADIILEWSIPGTRYKADGYCQETNTIYEFNGDYWHGNPKIYAPELLNETVQKTMGELYQTTIEREHKIKELGYNLIVVWESDF